MEVAEGLDRGVDQRSGALPVRHVMAADRRLAAGSGDLAHHVLSRRQIGAVTLQVAAEVVDDDAGAFGGERQRMRPAEPPTGPGHDGDAPGEAAAGHRARSANDAAENASPAGCDFDACIRPCLSPGPARRPDAVGEFSPRQTFSLCCTLGRAGVKPQKRHGGRNGERWRG